MYILTSSWKNPSTLTIKEAMEGQNSWLLHSLGMINNFYSLSTLSTKQSILSSLHLISHTFFCSIFDSQDVPWN